MNIPKQERRATPGIVCQALAIAVLLALSAAPRAQFNDLRLPISLDAESTYYDGKLSMIMFRQLKLSQGSIGVAADLGQASELDFEESTWQFSGNVRIDVEGGVIKCDAADLQFRDHVLTLATIEGQPATFEMQRPDSEQVTYAQAELLRYNLESGVIEFSGNAKIAEGGNEIASNTLVYDILERRINAQSTGEDGDRVKITYTPPAADDVPDQDGLPEDLPDEALDDVLDELLDDRPNSAPDSSGPESP